jgi:hypothetical protein
MQKEYYKSLTFKLQVCRILQGTQVSTLTLANFLVLQFRDFYSRAFQELASFLQTPPNISYCPEIIIIKIDF